MPLFLLTSALLRVIYSRERWRNAFYEKQESNQLGICTQWPIKTLDQDCQSSGATITGHPVTRTRRTALTDQNSVT
jgi:hypothetical protein